MEKIGELTTELALLLKQHKLTLSVAESCTGGLIGGAITELAGSSEFFVGGVIAYSNEIKKKLLHVPESQLITYGAVSSQVVESMAKGACETLESDCSIAISGIAGPGGGTIEKPVGLVYIGLNVKGIISSHRNLFSGTRFAIRQEAICKSLELLIDALKV